MRRERPQLVVFLPLEGAPTVGIDAETLEDERRLRRWLRRSSLVAALPAILTRLLDDLDDRDREAA